MCYLYLYCHFMCFVWKTSDLFRQINDFHVLNETIHNVLSDMILLTSYVLINHFMCFVWKTSDLFRQINDFHVLNETIHNVLSDMILLTSYILINPCNLITLSKFNFFVATESKVIYIYIYIYYYIYIYIYIYY